ncbi:MAG TPA: alkaline phosphatase family protein [Polyangiaceae bacterium]|jgi:hypothetical protein
MHARGIGLAALTVLTACGVGDGYRRWWDGDKDAVLPYPLPEIQVDAGKKPSDAGLMGEPDVAVEAAPPPAPPIQTVFFVLMSSEPWSAVEGSKSAPYINGTLLPAAAHCEAYYAAPAKIAQSEPNVVWLESGQDFGFVNNNPPATNHTASASHLVDELEAAGVTWKAYVEGATAGVCPIVDAYPMRVYNVPFVYFEDVSGTPPASNAKRCVEHVFPYTQLAADIAKNDVPRYAFIVPNACDDMHDECNTTDAVKQGDDWLSTAIPPILASKAYADAGAVFIAWDFASTGYVPIGFIALSPKARAGFAGTTTLTPSSALRSLQEIFGVEPLLGDATNATDVKGLFESFP